MTHVKVKIKKLRPDATIPAYGTPFAAGADLYACMDEPSITIESGETVFVHTGLAVELPEGTVGLVYARSGLAMKRGIAPANKVGVVDSDYRGELKIILINLGKQAFVVNNGERIAQIIVSPVTVADFKLTDSLSDTKRGEKGFGSTGV